MKKLIAIFGLFLFIQPVFAETVWEYVDRKLEKKKFKRWSLASWFYTQEQISLQDQWLSMNIDRDETLVEFYMDYAKSSFDQDTADNLNDNADGFSGEFGAYWGILGLVGRIEEYGDLYKQKELSFNLRVIGSSHQSTHLIFTYGARQFKGSSDEDFQQNFYGGDISLYLLPFLGFDGRYRYYMNDENPDGTHALRSARSQWGVFLDISFVRLFAYQFEENLKFNDYSAAGLNELQVKGTAAGIRLYF